LEAEVQHREEDIRQLNNKVSELLEEKDKALAKADEANRLRGEVQEKLDATRVVLSRRSDESVSDMDTLRTRIDRLERENAMLTCDNQSLAQRVMTIENVKNELRAARNEHDIECSAWNAAKNALEKEIKSLKEKLADQQLQSQRHEKSLADRNAALQEKIASFEDPRNATQREEELKQRESELRARLRDTLAENERLKTLLKQAKQSCSELETSLFESNSVLIRVQKENMELKRSGSSTPTAQSTPRGAASRRGDPFAGAMASPTNATGAPTGINNSNLSSGYAATQGAATKEINLLNIDPFSLARVDTRTSSRSPHGVDVGGTGTGSFRMGVVPSTRGSSPASFKDV
jgi:chromosome segregation ATPase